VTEVCYAVGFASPGSFSSRFTELAGVSPSEYRARDHRSAAQIPPCMLMLHTRPGATPS
jgi:AraC-like DNA-binding protein